MSKRLSREIRIALVVIVIARTAANAGLRMVYPFLPEIARGLGVSVATVAGLIALRNLGGLAAPLAARAAETIGRKTMMLIAIAAILVGALLTAGAPGVFVGGIGLVIVGLAKPSFDVPMQGWLGERVPYRDRGRVFGISELTWSISLLATVPASGFLIAATNWRVPFLLVAGLAAAGVVGIAMGIAPDRPEQRVRKPMRLTKPRVLILLVGFLFCVAAEMVFVVYGVWLEDDFGLSVAAIGVFTIAVGAAEFLGEGTVAAVADKVGLHRMIMIGLLVSAGAYLSLGLIGGSLVAAVAVVIVWLASFEITIVSTIPLVSELATESRDKLLGLLAMLVSFGRVVGALIATPIYDAGGIRASGFGAAGCVLLAGLLLLKVPSPSDPDAFAHSGHTAIVE